MRTGLSAAIVEVEQQGEVRAEYGEQLLEGTDVGRFMQSVQVASAGKLSAGEIGQVQDAFVGEYFSASKLRPSDFDAGISLFRVELEMAVISNAGTQGEVDAATRRIGSLLGVPVAGKGSGT